MKDFRRLFEYVWPQWPRVIAVVFTAMVIALLLSVSFMAIIPLLKVMIGNEGLHGWVDRKTCETAYGLQFRVPSADEPAGTYLQVRGVRAGSLAEKAGLQVQDRIGDVNDTVAEFAESERSSARRLEEGDVNDLAVVPETDVSYARLLQELAEAERETVPLTVRRGADPNLISTSIELATPSNQAEVDSLQWSALRYLKWKGQLTVFDAAQWALSFLPREQTDENKIKAVIAIMVIMLIITIIRCVAKFFQGYVGQKIVQTAITELRRDVFAHVTRTPMAVFTEERPSDLISRIMRDTSAMTSAIKVMLGKALREPMNALFMLGAAMLLNWKLSLVFLCGAPFVLILLGSFGKKMKKASRRSLEVSAQMLAKLQETAIGLRVVKVYNRQDYEQQQFGVINNQLLKQLLRMSRVDAATHPVLEVLGMLAGAAAIIVGMAWVTKSNLDGEEFLALLVLLGAAGEATRKTSDIWNKIQQANAAAERVFAVLDGPTEPEKPDAIALPPVKGDVEFRDIVFTYTKAEQPTLKGVSLTVTAGHNIAIVGANGSGKTTLANLLPRFYDPDSGQILVDGHDIRDITLQSLRAQIGMVTQQTITFNDTIRANISYGRDGASEADIVQAAQRAFAHEFISQIPEGYDTVIGEHGVGLSGGQLQRIVIARAILKNPAILIFDEATSQVDADSEAKIHKAIEEVMQDRTTFIIAHRFSTVVAADVIVVMDRGRIVAQGQHEELIGTCPIYQGLYETQLVRA